MPRLPFLSAVLSAIVFGSMTSVAVAQAKASCAAGKTGKPSAITAAQAWELASERARQWQTDAVPFEFTTSSQGPLDAEGRSTDWSINFSSQHAKAVDMISITDGQIRCFTVAGAGGRVLTSVAQILFDTKKLRETADKAGGNTVGPGAKVAAGLEQGTSGAPEWIFNYQNAQGREVLSVLIDAKSGKTKKVFHEK